MTLSISLPPVDIVTASPVDLPVAQVLGYRVHLGTMAQAVGSCLARQAMGLTTWVVTLNPEMIMRGQADPAFNQCLHTADLCLPDGAGAIWALKRQGIAQPRLPGIEFADALMAELARQQGRVALIGALPAVVETAQQRLLAKYPGLQIPFAHDGYFSPEQTPALMAQAVAAQPSVVLVALGVPRQELLIEQYRHQFAPGTVFVGVGGSFDVWSGTINRAPALFRALNLEWAWRLGSQPWRIQRSLKPLLRFVFQIINSSQP
jgi:N-acetylglucosaminyldiphosphoundecaprenol N-acetyl-beta-D-mannosaminyltransferase